MVIYNIFVRFKTIMKNIKLKKLQIKLIKAETMDKNFDKNFISKETLEDRKKEYEEFYKRVEQSSNSGISLNFDEIVSVFGHLDRLDKKDYEEPGLELCDLIENKLNSKLQLYLYERSFSRFFKKKEYEFWHKVVKDELAKLRNFISERCIRQYISYCFNNFDMDLLYEYLQSNSMLSELILARKLFQEGSAEFNYLNVKLENEWKRVKETVPEGAITRFCYSVLKSNQNLPKVV